MVQCGRREAGECRDRWDYQSCLLRDRESRRKNCSSSRPVRQFSIPSFQPKSRKFQPPLSSPPHALFPHPQSLADGERFSATGNIDSPTLIHILTPQNLILATDSGALHLYDLRSKDSSFASSKPAQTHHPHDDYVSSLTSLPASAASTSGFPKQVVTTGGTTLAVTDIRRGVLAKSEDQGEELLSSCFVGGLSSRGTSVGEKLTVGGASGVLSLWERGVWDDMDERIVLDKGPNGGESVDALVSLPDDVVLSEGGKGVVAGMGNGMVVFCEVGGQNGIVDILRHDEAEGVVGLGFDVAGRMISGGGHTVKVWHEVGDIEMDEQDEEEEGEEANGKRAGGEDSESWEDEESSEDEKPEKKRKRRKGLAGINRNGFSFQGLD